jgi:DNA-binding response OmpR family regulator
LSLHEEFEALAVENGSKGVQAAKAGLIDLVIMDVGLPDIDGREAVRISRRRPASTALERQTGRELETAQKSDATSMAIASRSRHQLVAARLGDQDGGGGGVLFDLLP